MRHLVAWAACAVAAAWLTLLARDAGACGEFTRPLSESEIAERLPYLAIERVLLVWDERTQTEDFVREARFERANQDFGFVVPVPSRPEVFKVERAPFDDLARVFPFAPPVSADASSGRGQGIGGGAQHSGVDVLSEQRIGSFDVFVLSATDGGGLKAWLEKNGFAVPAGSQEWLDHFVRLGFYYAAFRYDAQASATPGMTSQTVRIRFKTALPYYPYREPARASPPRGPRSLLLWFVSQNEATPVVPYTNRAGELAWRKPWEGAEARSTTAKEIRNAMPSLEALIPGDEGARWSLIAFRDAKTNRAGYGDVLLAPSAPVAIDDAAIAARWPLLPLLDPRLEGDLDPVPLRAQTFAPAPPRPQSGAVSPQQSLSRPQPGCAVAPGTLGGADTSSGEGVGVLLLAGVAAMVARRKSLRPIGHRHGRTARVALLALVAVLSSCKKAPPPPARFGPTPEPATTAFLPGAAAVTFTADGAQLLVGEGRLLRVVDPASATVLSTMDVVAASEQDAGAGGEIVRLFSLDAHRALVHWKVRDDRSGGQALLSLVDLIAQRCTWTDLIGSGVDASVAVSDDGSQALVLGEGKIGLRDLRQNRLVREWTKGPSEPFAFAGANRAVLPGPSKLEMVDLATGNVERSFPVPLETQSAIAVTPDGTRAVTLTSYGSALRVWDVPSGREVRSFDMYGFGAPVDATLSRDGRRAYTDHGTRVCAWDLDAGARVGCTDAFAYTSLRSRLALSPDGHVLAYCTLQGIRLWKVLPTPEEEASGAAHPGRTVAPWPSAPGWIASSPTPTQLTPSTDGGRAERETSTLAVLLGQVNAARMTTFAQESWHDSRHLMIRPVAAAVAVEGKLPVEPIDRIVRQNIGRFRLCYQQGLRGDGTLSGKANVAFVIDHTGSVSKVTTDGLTLPDAAVLACIARGFGNLSFPVPAAGEVHVKYPLEMIPDD